MKSLGVSHIVSFSAVGYLDRVSLFVGVHEQSAVAVVDLGFLSSTIYCYVFHRRVADGSFKIAEEHKKRILPGLFDPESSRPVHSRVQEIVSLVHDLIPEHIAAQATTKDYPKK